MNTTPSIPVVAAGDWLVVIDRREASVFRSLVTGAAPQLIRSRSPDCTGTRSAPERYLNGGERSGPPAFFEPLAGVLHGAGRILIFGRAGVEGSEADPFIGWLRDTRPSIAQRIVGSVWVHPDHCDEVRLLAQARDFFDRVAFSPPPEPAVAQAANGRSGSH